jgi:hypothetical protein
MDEHPDALSLSTIEQVVAEFAELSMGRGTVVTCGGEPTLAKERYWGLCGAARANGLRMFSVQNGTRIKTLDDAKKTLLEGPHEVTISLDGPDAEMHDRFRGAKGSFAIATRALRLLLEARECLSISKSESKIYAMTILCNSMHGNLDRFFQLVLGDIGADKLKLNIVAPTFNSPDNEGHVDPYFEQEHLRDVDKLIDEIKAVDAKWNLPRNPVWLEQLRMYAKSIEIKRARKSLVWSTLSETTTEHICNTYERNIMMSDLGVMRLCFSGKFPGLQWSSPGDMRRFWVDWADEQGIRSDMRGCNRLCASSHSQRNSPSLL